MPRLALPALLLAASYAVPCAPPVAASPGTAAAGAAQIRDARIQRAIDWLPRRPAVPVEVVDPRQLAPRVANAVRRACGFVNPGVARIYILSTCRVYRRAEHSPLDAIALAAVIGHEMAHLDGAGEAAAREVEIDLVRTLASRLPGEYQVRSAQYVADLRRRTPVACETSAAAGTFHTCPAAGAASDGGHVRKGGASGAR